MMAGHCFMVGQCAHTVFWCRLDVVQIGVKHSRARSIHGWAVVVGACGSLFGKLGNTVYFNSSPGLRLERLGQTCIDFLNDGHVVGQNLVAAFAGVRVVKTFFSCNVGDQN